MKPKVSSLFEVNLRAALTVTATVAVTLLSRLAVTVLTTYYKQVKHHFVTDDSKYSFFEY